MESTKLADNKKLKKIHKKENKIEIQIKMLMQQQQH